VKLAEHPNVELITGEIEAGPKDTVETVIVVYTDLELDGLSPRYQKDKVDSLIEAAHQHMKANPNAADKVRIRTKQG